MKYNTAFSQEMKSFGSTLVAPTVHSGMKPLPLYKILIEKVAYSNFDFTFFTDVDLHFTTEAHLLEGNNLICS
jgi:hypothetical protein